MCRRPASLLLRIRTNKPATEGEDTEGDNQTAPEKDENEEVGIV